MVRRCLGVARMEGLHEPVLREVDAFGLRRALLFLALHMPCAAGHKASLQTCVPGLILAFLCVCTLRTSSLPRARKKNEAKVAFASTEAKPLAWALLAHTSATLPAMAARA